MKKFLSNMKNRVEIDGILVRKKMTATPTGDLHLEFVFLFAENNKRKHFFKGHAFRENAKNFDAIMELGEMYCFIGSLKQPKVGYSAGHSYAGRPASFYIKDLVRYDDFSKNAIQNRRAKSNDIEDAEIEQMIDFMLDKDKD